MPTTNRINANSRKEMVCPSCQQQGLKEAPKFSEQCDSEKEKILYATACSNPDCQNYGSREDPGRVPPEKIKQQYSPSKSRSLPEGGSMVKLLIGIGALAGAMLLLLSGGGVLSDSGGTAQANPYSDLNESSNGVNTVETIDPWTVYEVDGEYYVAGVQNGQVVYLDRNGEIVTDLVTFDSSDDATDAIQQWQTRQEQGLANESVTQAPEDLVDGSPWAVYEYNGSAFIAAEQGDEVVYLNSSLGVQDSPYLYDNVSEARDTLLEFESDPAGLVDGSDWETIDYGDDTFVGATPDDGPYSEETVFLDPDGDISEDPYFYDSPSDANDAIDNFDGWNDTEKTVDFDGGGGGGSGASGGGSTSDGDGSGAGGGDSTSDGDGSGAGGGDSTSDGDGSSLYDDYDDTTYSSPEDTIDQDLNATAPSGNLSENIDSTEQTSGVNSSAAVRGTVTDQSGNPVEGATVHLYSTHSTTTTDSTGAYEFSDIPTGEHEIHVAPPEDSGLTATQNTTFTVESSGITSVEDNRGSSYYMQNGLVTESRINFNPRPESPVQLTGQGTNVSATLQIANTRNADNLTAEFNSVYTAGISQEQVSSSDGTRTLRVEGGAEPETQSVAVDGKVTTASRSTTLEAGDTFRRDGNLPSGEGTVTVVGQGSSIDRTIQGTGQKTVTNQGNLQGTNATLKVYGSETTNSVSTSGTGSGRITNGGNLETTADITIEGNTITESKSTSGSIAGSEASTAITVDGTQEPVSESVTVSSGESEELADTLVGTYKEPSIDVRSTVSGSSKTDVSTDRVSTTVSKGGVYRIESSNRYDPLRMYLKVYNEAGKTAQVERIYSKWTVKIDRADGGTETVRTFSQEVRNIDEEGDGGSALARRFVNAAGSIGHVNAGDRVILIAETRIETGPNNEVLTYARASGQNDITVGADRETQLVRRVGAGETQVTVQNKDTGQIESSKSVYIGPSGSETVSIDISGVDDYALNIDAQSKEVKSYDASWTDRFTTKNVEVDTNGDGTPEITHQGLLLDGESATGEVPVAPGGAEVDISNSGPSPAWEASMTEVTAVKNPQYQVSTNTGRIGEQGDILRDGELKEVDIGQVPSGDFVTEVESDGANTNWELTFTENTATEGPKATLGDGTVSDTGVLEPGETKTVHTDSFQSKEYAVETQSVSGPPPIVKVDYAAKAAPEQATVYINGQQYQYPRDFNESGALTLQTDAVNTTSVVAGDNDVRVSSASVDGIDTTAVATIRYPGQSIRTAEPTIYIIQPDGTVTQQSVPQTALSDGKLTDSYALPLKQNAFGAGENLVIAETPDGSQVEIAVTGTTSTIQSDIFEPTTTIPANATVP